MKLSKLIEELREIEEIVGGELDVVIEDSNTKLFYDIKKNIKIKNNPITTQSSNSYVFGYINIKLKK